MQVGVSVVPLPPGDYVIKWYMAMIIEIAHIPKLEYISHMQMRQSIARC